ncbi:MAG: hypothetical protein M3Y72_00315 [Acidobacteriota bacterium]|nr:hypothetical protein [Acidobacteriota bacterium]
MSTTLDQARSAIASEIGPDVAEFTPTGEKHFIAEAALLDMVGSFLFAFFKGVAKKASDVAQDKVGGLLGTAIGDAFGSLLNRLRHKEPPVSDKELQAAQAEAATTVKELGLSQAQIDAIGKAVAEAMTSALSQQADREISNRVVDRVKQEGLKTIGQEA